VDRHRERDHRRAPPGDGGMNALVPGGGDDAPAAGHGITVTVHGAVLEIAIDRPHVRNALDSAASRAMAAAIDELERRDNLTVGVIAGRGGTFCAGMDLKAYLDGDNPEIPDRGFGGITTTPPTKPLVAAVEGWAVAGGLELVLACDVVIAAVSARFGLPEVKRGLIAGGGGLIRLPRAIPRAVAMQMLLTGDPIGASQAATLGLVGEVVPDGQARTRALDVAGRIAANPTGAVQATKRLVTETETLALAQAFRAQRATLDEVFVSEEARAGTARFVADPRADPAGS
jgi:enoyl-CoA hydratase